MALRAFKQVQFKAFDLLQFQASVKDFHQQLTLCPFLTGAYAKGQAIGTSATIVNHGLGQAPQGYFVLTRGANATVWQTAATTTTITLQASAPVTVDLWIF